MRITDSQVHIWESPTLFRPWPAGGDGYAHGDRFTVEQVLPEMDSGGVARAVLVPPSFEGDYNDLCLAAAAAHPDRFGVMGRLDVSDRSNAELLPCWQEIPSMLGIRLTFARDKSADWLSDGTADWFWAEAERAGIPVMVFAPGNLRALGEVASRHPSLRIAVDHMGLAMDLPEEEIDRIVAELVRLAKLPNLAVKATCLPRYAWDSYPFTSMHARLERVVDAFGPRRVFWGSDVTRLPCPYRQAVQVFLEELPFLEGDDLELVMGEALSAWLDWP